MTEPGTTAGKPATRDTPLVGHSDERHGQARYWDSVASSQASDESVSRLHPIESDREKQLIHAILAWRARYLFAGLAPQARLLDLACGTGQYLWHLPPQFRGDYVGVDFSAGMIGRLRERLQREPLPRLNSAATAVGSALDWHDPAGFDHIICVGMLLYVPPADRAGFLLHVRSMLRPGGRFVFDFWNRRYFAKDSAQRSDGDWSVDECIATAGQCGLTVADMLGTEGLKFRILQRAAFQIERSLAATGALGVRALVDRFGHRVYVSTVAR